MGLFDFIAEAGDKLFGGDTLDENKVREHIAGLGLKLKPFSVVAHQKDKMVSLIGWAETLQDKEKAILAAGNIKGVKKVDDRLKVGMPPATRAETAPVTVGNAPEPDSTEQPSSRFYTVQSGDTLSKIAREYYGSASKYPLIFEANKPMLTNPDRIYPGQVLRIPEA
ncbi:MAG: peptidoglycan-binding protein LysM [Gammaproteobacteria bacterium]